MSAVHGLDMLVMFLSEPDADCANVSIGGSPFLTFLSSSDASLATSFFIFRIKEAVFRGNSCRLYLAWFSLMGLLSPSAHGETPGV
jgi:hypothetical protein